VKKGKQVKTGIVLVLFLLVVGFAAVSATMNINGTASFTGNATEFANNLRFVKETDPDKKPTMTSSLSKEVVAPTVTADGKTLKFTTPVLDTVNETATVSYWVENYGQYAAKFTGINCGVTSDTETNVEYIEVTPSQNYVGTTLEAATGSTPTQTTEKATIEVKLKKTYASDEEASVTITCQLTAEAQEK